MASTVRGYIAFCLVTFAAAILGGCSNGSSGANGASAATSAATGSGALTISGNPAASVAAGSSYSFRPTVSDASGAALTFAIQNQPGWALMPATGTLTGTPTSAYVGSFAQIVITVSDGSATAPLAAFSIEVTQPAPGVATLSWTVPTVSAAGTEPAGYHIYYGESSTHLTHIVDISNPDSSSFVVDNLPSGTWYFAVKSYNGSDVESILSAIVPVTIG